MWKADAHKVRAPVSSSWLGAVWRPSHLLASAWPHVAVCRVFWQSSWGFLISGVLHVCVAWESRTSQGWFTRVELGFSLSSLAAPSYPFFLESSLCSVSMCWNVGHTQGFSLLSLISTSALTHPDIPKQRFLVISGHGSIISLLDTCALIFYSFQLSLSSLKLLTQTSQFTLSRPLLFSGSHWVAQPQSRVTQEPSWGTILTFSLSHFLHLSQKKVLESQSPK